MPRSSVSGVTWYFYPRSPRGERRLGALYKVRGFIISIHALLAESDPVT